MFMTQHSTSFQAVRPLIALALAACALSANAALVTWSAPSAIAGDADVRTNGTLVMAYNLGHTQAATVNGVSFQSFSVGAAPLWPADHVHTVGNATLTQKNRERADHVLSNFDRSVNLGPFSGLTAGYRNLLFGSAGSSFPDRFGNPTVLTLAGLVVGQVYEFQTWFNDSRLSGCCAFGLGLWNADDDMNRVDLSPNLLRDGVGNVVAGGLGQFVLGTFTASANTQSFAYMREEIAGGLSGFQLRQQAPARIPEPGSLPLLAVALMAASLVWRQRRVG